MKLSIVIPAYNEGKRIGQSLEAILSFSKEHLSQWEVIVVDDGSSDQTAARAASVEGITLLRNEKNCGKGYSVRRGMLQASLDPVLFTDADLSTPIEEALSLHAAIAKGADIAIASRKPSRRKRVKRTLIRKCMASVFRLCVKILALRGFHDTQCGFKMFRGAVVKPVFSLQRLERWGFDVELLLIARKNGLRVVEVPVDWREADESSLTAGAPFSMLLDLLKVRWHALLGHYRHRWRGDRAAAADD